MGGGISGNLVDNTKLGPGKSSVMQSNGSSCQIAEDILVRNRKKPRRARLLAQSKTANQEISPENNGWNNLTRLLAFLFISRFILMSFMESGFRMKIPLSNISCHDAVWFFACLFVIFLRCCFCYFLNLSNADLSVVVAYIPVSECLSSIMVYLKIKHVFLACWLYILSLSYDMKMYSFLINGREPSTMLRFLKFLSYPTLVYKEEYQMKSKRNWGLIWTSAFKLVAFLLLLCFFLDQHAVPAIIKLITSSSSNSFIEGFMHLSISSIILFNLFFRIFFDCGMTILSELTLFDEKIFGEWWNSRSTADFWKNWNLPVHNFMKEHIYTPLIKRGVNRSGATFVCFLFSGFIHEYVVSMTLKFFNGWFLLGMVVQIPLYYITNMMKEKAPSIANSFFWICFCAVGQPIGMFLICKGQYYRSNVQQLRDSAVV
ncbi:uncharacterized protein VICG_00178 [Vittaforma corneae ATCC 50505]|uniref:O-acyltransferase n=1 Tax=Vittaforma corneae (strain ATCC 50505) TaxID=993615 RepID=L2GPP4_VITCO|nr:uncharacterized protein VICG_00178 [Vittaforma corneae ATCC 50505]ELA42863.1 hypothetical protein VICG_00178 [Vittaforma corneae ATCC 50505]